MQGSMRWVIGGVAAVVVVAAVVAVVLVMRLNGGGPAIARGKPLDVTTWAHQMCTAEAAYADSITKVFDGLDPASLDLEARKQRADRIGKVEIDAASQVAKTLKGITPPEAARTFHQALIQDADEEVAATKEQLDVIAKATNAQQIVLANAQVRFRREASSQNLTAAAQNLAPDVQTALTQEPLCQGSPVPLAPGGAPSAPGAAPRGTPARPAPGRGPA